MHVIEARNVQQALPLGIQYLIKEGHLQDSRAGRVIVAPGPVTTTYTHPTEKVLLSHVRDANPFFHLMEAMWLLNGRDDTPFLNHYVKDFGARFAEYAGTESEHLHGSYGRRWRHSSGYDQLKVIVERLRAEPATRQCVLQMWDATDGENNDLRGSHRDRPCNTHVYFRMRRGELDMLVSCRSNDIIMGAYGANAVQFGFLLDYMAGMVGVPVGRYWQVSWDYHAYVNDLERLAGRVNYPFHSWDTAENRSVTSALLSAAVTDKRHPSPPSNPLVVNPVTFGAELNKLHHMIDWLHADGWVGNNRLREAAEPGWNNRYLNLTVFRAAVAHWLFKNDDPLGAKSMANGIADPAWSLACVEWLKRRRK